MNVRLPDNEKLNSIFRESLVNIWNQIKTLFSSNIDQDLKAGQLNKIANEFYNIFKDTEIPIHRELQGGKKSAKVYIQIQSKRIKIPGWFWIVLKKFDPPPDFNLLFNLELNWKDILSELLEEEINRQLPLLPVDIQIIQHLSGNNSNHFFTKNLDVPPNQLSLLLEVSSTWIRNRLAYFQETQLLATRFIVNPFFVKFKLYLLISNREDIKYLQDLDKYTLFSVMLSNQQDNVRIIQIPWDTTPTLDLVNNFLSIPVNSYYKISDISLSYQLEHLNADNRHSFSDVPRFDSKMTKVIVPNVSYSEQAAVEYLLPFIEENASQYALFNKISLDKRQHIILSVLYSLQYQSSNDIDLSTIAKSVDLSATHYKLGYQILYKFGIISYHPKITHIGCPIRYGIMIKSNIQINLEEIRQKLLQLPVCQIFQGEKILFVYVELSEKWMSRFLRYITILQTQEDIDLTYGVFISLKTQNRVKIDKIESFEQFKIRMID